MGPDLVQLGIRVEVAGDKKSSSSFLRHAADSYKRLSLENYLDWTIGSIRGRFPTTMIRQINATLRPEMQAFESGILGGKNVTLRRQPFNGAYMYYICVDGFYDGRDSLLLESPDLEKLRLYFQLQYGEIEWRED